MPTPPQTDLARQLAYGLVSALVIIGQHSVLGEIGIRSHEQHERNSRVVDQLAQRRTERLWSLGQQDAVDTLGKQHFQALFLPLQTIIAIAEQNVISVLLSGIFRTANHQREKGVGDIGNDDSDGVSTPLRQTARQQVRTVAQL